MPDKEWVYGKHWKQHTFSAFVASVISVAAGMSSTGDLLVATIFNWVVCIGLAQALTRVVLALHFAQRNTPLGVTTQDQITNLQVMNDCIHKR